MRLVTALRIALLIAVVLTLVQFLDSSRPIPVAAAPMSGSDRLLAAPRGNPEIVLAYAERARSARLGEVRAYVNEVYRLAPLVGLDPAIVIAQSAHETNFWRSFYWITNLNPAGIGVSPFATPSAWATGADAARGHLHHLYIYAAGVPVPGQPLYQYRYLAPGWGEAALLGYVGAIDRLFDLTGRWATDGLYHSKVSARGNEIFGGGPAVTGPSPEMAIVASRASRGNSPARAYDGSLNTSWAVLDDRPAPTSYAQFDIGRSVNLTSLRWIFRVPGWADQYRIRISTDGFTWTTIAFRYDPPVYKWLGFPVARTARYVRFYMDNPNGDHNLGYLAEVRFITGGPSITDDADPIPTVTPTPTPRPDLPHPAFAEQDGLVVIEAEHAHDVIARDGHIWTLRSDVPGYSGDGYLGIEPDNGHAYISGYTTTRPVC